MHIEQELATLRLMLSQAEEGRWWSRQYGIDVTPRDIAHLRTDIAALERTVARYRQA